MCDSWSVGHVSISLWRDGDTLVCQYIMADGLRWCKTCCSVQMVIYDSCGLEVLLILGHIQAFCAPTLSCAFGRAELWKESEAFLEGDLRVCPTKRKKLEKEANIILFPLWTVCLCCLLQQSRLQTNTLALISGGPRAVFFVFRGSTNRNIMERFELQRMRF